MKKVVYFHGLESSQGGKKVDFLANLFLVHAPAMDYNEEGVWSSTKDKVKIVEPNLVIGSSMGGLMACHSSFQLKTHLLLFNPAFERKDKYIEESQQDFIGDKQMATIDIILGKNDTEVNPISTIEFIKATGLKANIKELEIEHRIPLELFESEVKQFREKYHL